MRSIRLWTVVTDSFGSGNIRFVQRGAIWPRKWIAAFVLSLLCVAACQTKISRPMGDRVRVESGELQGLAEPDCLRFFGVPYAAPPVGPLRWCYPRPVSLWSGVRDATKPPMGAPQGSGSSAKDITNEDCLYLNITVPRRASGHSHKPVMVWLHGGGFSGGKGISYDPQRMAVAGDVIVVTVEFRLNIFGCFGFPGLEDSGTFILLDQQAALRWIQRNIAAFGGDPKNVTLFGESGGAIATCGQLTSPSAKGLFQKVILQSGAATTSWPRNAANLGPIGSLWRPIDEVERAGEELAVGMGCPEPRGSAAALAWLRNQPASKLLLHSGDFASAAYGGAVLPIHPAVALKEGRFFSMPILSGFTRHEGRALALGMQMTSGGTPMTEEAYQKLLVEGFGELAGEVQSRYPSTNYSSPGLAWAAVYTDRMFACPQLTATRQLARRGPAFVYEFADTNAPGLLPFFPGFPPGASHSGELPFLFDVEKNPIDMTGQHVPLTEDQVALGATMIRYWVQFARSGNPNAKKNPSWPPFSPNDKEPWVQVLNSGPNGIQSSRKVEEEHQCGFWNGIRN